VAELIFYWLLLISGAVGAGIVCVALLRQAVRRNLGAQASMWLWWIVPIAVLSLLIPKTSVVSLMASHAAVSVFASDPAQSVALVQSFDWRECMLWVWLAGLMVFVLRAAIRQRRFTARIVWPAHTKGILPAGEEPSVVGILFPRIALPVDFRFRYAADEQKLVLLHEYAHIARFDGLINLVTQLILCLQWFNPLAHWAAGAIGRDQELACDAIVACRHPKKLKVYAEAMLKAAQGHQSNLPLVSQWNSYHPTVERIAMLSQHRRQNASTKLASVALILGGALASALVYAARPEGIIYRVADNLPTIAFPSSLEPASELKVAKRPDPDGINKISAAGQTPKAAELGKALSYLAESAPQKTTDDSVARQNYLVKYSLTLAKNDGASPPRITTKRSESSMVLPDAGRAVLEVPGDTRISMVVRQSDDKILFQAVIESIAEQRIIARPTLLVLPGAKGSIKIGESNERGLIDGVEIDVTITPISAEEAVALRSKPRPQSPPGGLCNPGTTVSNIQSTLIALMPVGVAARSVSSTNGAFTLSGLAQSQALVDSFVRSIAQAGDFEVLKTTLLGQAKPVASRNAGESDADEFEMSFSLRCNG
jgi:beta-lactamase regulating signal transducer with metallopeptidase domain